MKIRITAFALLITASAFQCQTTPNLLTEGSTEDSGKCESVLWLQPYIDGLKNNTDAKSEVIQYQYKGQTVYYIDSCKGCADSMGVVYNCIGEIICRFGGIAGFNTCPDFAETATHKKVIFQN